MEAQGGRARALAVLTSAAGRIRLASLIPTASAIAWIHQELFHRQPGPACPKCGRQSFSARFLEAWWAGRSAQCPSCHATMTWRTGTPFRGSSLGPSQVVVLLAGLGAGVPRDTLAGWLGVCGRTVENWAQRMAEASHTTPAEPGRGIGPLFCGPTRREKTS